LSAVAGLVAQGPRTIDEMVAAFSSPKREQVTRHLETLALMGEVLLDDAGRYGTAVRVG